MINVLFVCLGNICRSPLAEGILIHALRDKGLENQVRVDSAGTSNYHIGDSPDPRTMRNARENHVILTSKARQFSEDDFKNFDHILAMDTSNYQNILRLDRGERYEHKVRLLREFDSQDKGADVPDPYFGGEDGFAEVFEIVDRSVRAFLDHLIEHHSLTPSEGSTSN
jgi:protein-tyrosine phosphatase